MRLKNVRSIEDVLPLTDGSGKNGKNGLRRIIAYLTAIVLTGAVFTLMNNMFSIFHRSDYEMERFRQEMNKVCTQIESIESKLSKGDLDEVKYRAEMKEQVKVIKEKVLTLKYSVGRIEKDIMHINISLKGLVNDRMNDGKKEDKK